MAKLHDSKVRESIKGRVKAVRSDSPRKWGGMTADQMLWHVNGALEMAMGRLHVPMEKVPLPRPLLRILVLNLPWPKGAPTAPLLQAKAQYDLEAERARCLKLIDDFAAMPLGGVWSSHPAFGPMNGEQYSRLMAKHLNHHLTQFSA